MPPAATALFPHSKADKEAAIELLSECGGTWAYVQLVLDISSWLIVPCTAWSTTPWIFGLAFGPMVIMSLAQQQEQGHFQTLLSSVLPVLMFLPSGQALLSRRALGALLRLACLLCCFLALKANDEQFGAHYGQDMHEDFHNSHALGCDSAHAPSWLQPCCASQQINLTTFLQCQEDLPWYRQTSCRTQAAAVCQAPGTRPTRIWIIFWPLLAILGLLPAQCCLHTWLGVQPNAGRTYEAAIRMVQDCGAVLVSYEAECSVEESIELDRHACLLRPDCYSSLNRRTRLCSLDFVESRSRPKQPAYGRSSCTV